jgi:hypothetical protein
MEGVDRAREMRHGGSEAAHPVCAVVPACILLYMLVPLRFRRNFQVPTLWSSPSTLSKKLILEN